MNYDESNKKYHLIKNSYPLKDKGIFNIPEPSVTEPFNVGRNTPRLLFDFSVMTALLKTGELCEPILDFGSGTGWITEFCARMGYKTVAFDIHNNLQACLENRVDADNRINGNLINFSQGDGHNMPFEDNLFGSLLCYDTLHHMRDYQEVFCEFFRVLKNGGRAIFVEPGARHSSSPETINFLKNRKPNDIDWLERDVVLEEIDKIAREAGFNHGVKIVPMPSTLAMQEFSLQTWQDFIKGDVYQRQKFSDQLAQINYWDRVIFYVDKF